MLSISWLARVMLECITFIKYVFYLAAANNSSVVKNFSCMLHSSGAASTESCCAVPLPLQPWPAGMAWGREAWHTGKMALAKFTFWKEEGHGHKPEILMVLLLQHGPSASGIKELWPKQAGFSIAFVIPSVGSKLLSLLSSEMSWK